MRTGIDPRTGKLVQGWPHCEIMIGRCLTTRFGSVPTRRHHGSSVPAFQDDNADPNTIMRFFVAIADALADPDSGEPGYRLTSVKMISASRSGRFAFLLSGFFFPRGHLGDFSIYETRSIAWPEGVSA